MKKTEDCPQCKGAGQYDMLHESSKTEYPVNCTICEGKGVIPKDVFLAMKKNKFA